MGIFMGFSWRGDPRPGREQQVSQMNASWALSDRVVQLYGMTVPESGSAKAESWALDRIPCGSARLGSSAMCLTPPQNCMKLEEEVPKGKEKDC